MFWLTFLLQIFSQACVYLQDFIKVVMILLGAMSINGLRSILLNGFMTHKDHCYPSLFIQTIGDKLSLHSESHVRTRSFSSFNGLSSTQWIHVFCLVFDDPNPFMPWDLPDVSQRALYVQCTYNVRTLYQRYVHCTNGTYNVRTLYVQCPLGSTWQVSTDK